MRDTLPFEQLKCKEGSPFESKDLHSKSLALQICFGKEISICLFETKPLVESAVSFRR